MSTFQLTLDCTEPAVLTRFWATALGYDIEAPPTGFTTWNAYWRGVGVPEDELDDEVEAAETLIDPTGQGPRIWFLQVPEAKAVKNRWHRDLNCAGRTVPLATRREKSPRPRDLDESVGSLAISAR